MTEVLIISVVLGLILLVYLIDRRTESVLLDLQSRIEDNRSELKRLVVSQQSWASFVRDFYLEYRRDKIAKERKDKKVRQESVRAQKR